ncbi:YczE/YyaS/YitT family protein [Cellulosilyticum sp. I15G10I2]|uniref:YczE/YyaS/YitT family protein n=1 Tax=Cellulosilyticum sp. I15G10I2 TaxID=1892843 RepID=UPI00085C95D2|nr:hypothetical protein [Cellulosilyticum sp. I15G10I2]
MKLKRLFTLFLGILLYGLGIVLSIKANLGISPWDAFHQGLSALIGVTLGQAGIGVGLLILVFNYWLKEKIGFGTIVNIFGIGLVIDLLFYLDLIPTMNTLLSGIITIIVSMFTIALASYFYIGAGYGTGPRDGLMVGLVKKTNKKVGLIRGSIELTVLGIGFMLGGKIGLGTVILGIGIGPVVQLTFRLLRFNVSGVKHEYLFEKNKSADYTTEEQSYKEKCETELQFTAQSEI